MIIKVPVAAALALGIAFTAAACGNTPPCHTTVGAFVGNVGVGVSGPNQGCVTATAVAPLLDSPNPVSQAIALNTLGVADPNFKKATDKTLDDILAEKMVLCKTELVPTGDGTFKVIFRTAKCKDQPAQSTPAAGQPQHTPMTVAAGGEPRRQP